MMWAYTFIAAVNICVVNVTSDIKMSYVFERPLNASGFCYLGSHLFGQVSIIFSVIRDQPVGLLEGRD